jgi:hypothetical protein
VSAPLERICSASPSCPGALRGRPRLLLLARLPPGSLVEPIKCQRVGERVKALRLQKALEPARPDRTGAATDVLDRSAAC